MTKIASFAPNKDSDETINDFLKDKKFIQAVITPYSLVIFYEDLPKSRPSKNNKNKYADHVSMPEADYNKLIASYGKAMTEECISELNKYKGSSGRTYKDDYLAILSWVVDKYYIKHPEVKRVDNNYIKEHEKRLEERITMI